MQAPLRVLILEDRASDAELVERELGKGNLRFVSQRVETEPSFRDALEEFRPDVVLADYTLPQFSGMKALSILRELSLHIPFVLVTGSLSEEVAVECMKIGSDDYVLKTNLKRLPIAVENALQKKAVAQQKEEAERALRVSEERYALAANGSKDGIWDWDLVRGRIFLSSRWKSMLGFDENDLEEKPETWFSRVHVEDIEILRKKIQVHLDGASPHFEHEYRILHRDGSLLWVLCRGLAVRNASGHAVRMAGSQTDISERKNAEQQILFGALHDSLTELPNRLSLSTLLGHCLGRAKREDDYSFAVLALGIDRFKSINQSLGHKRGDELLVAIARRLELLARPGDALTRLGGDEFVFFFDSVANPLEAKRLGDRVLRELATPFLVGGKEIFTSASIGIAIGGAAYQRAGDLIRDAETALHRAKARGKGRCEIFTRGMHLRAVEQLDLENDLRRAVKQGGFHLYYQPIVSLATGRIEGLEALIRWQHPQRGILAPSKFIVTAEKTGLIIPIGRLVLSAACRQLREWQERYPSQKPLFVSVNLSGRQFLHPALAKEVHSAISESGIEPDSLILEITEHTLMRKAEASNRMMKSLKELPIRIHIDDFGTGYSSLSYLTRLPIDALKIDRSFMNHKAENGENMKIVETIIGLARSLGMGVTTEGVENGDQLEKLRALRCELAQGYFFSKPVPAHEVPVLLTSQPLA